MYVFRYSTASKFARDGLRCTWRFSKVGKLTFPSDIFQLKNKLNLRLQEPSKTVFNLGNQIEFFKTKLKVWWRRLHKNTILMVPFFFSEFICDTDLREVRSSLQHYTKILQTHCGGYFPQSFGFISGKLMVIDPFLPREKSQSIPFTRITNRKFASIICLVFVLKFVENIQHLAKTI